MVVEQRDVCVEAFSLTLFSTQVKIHFMHARPCTMTHATAFRALTPRARLQLNLHFRIWASSASAAAAVRPPTALGRGAADRFKMMDVAARRTLSQQTTCSFSAAFCSAQSLADIVRGTRLHNNCILTSF